MTAPKELNEAIDRGMRAQLQAFQENLARGVPRTGWKIGVTDPAAQERFGLDAPLIGWLAGDRVQGTPARLQPRSQAILYLESEIAIRLDREVPPDGSLETARAAIAGLGPAVEIIDLSKPGDGLETILGHSIFHECVIFGEETQSRDLEHRDDNWPQITRNDSEIRVPEASLVPQDLAALVLLTAKRLAPYGESLRAGDRIISGSFTRPMPIESGDSVQVDFGPLGLGKIDVQIGT